MGLPCIEIDVWQITDSEIVVFHDAFLERLTNASGFISETSYAELKNIPLKNGDRIPTLQEVIALIKPYDVELIVEIKAENAFEKTTEILTAFLPFTRYFIGSFFHQPILNLKQKNPEIRTAIMLEGVPVNVANYLQTVNPELVVLSIETFNQEIISEVKKQGRKLIFYTVNTPPQIALAQRAKPNAIITNFPDLFLT